MKTLFNNPGFRRLWLGDLVSLMGDWLSLVAVSVLAMNHGQGAMALALVLAAHTLPQALVSPLAGVLVDRFDRRTLLVAGNLVQAAFTALMALAAAMQDVTLVQIALVLRTAVAAVTIPAQNAALPRLIEASQLLRANAILSATWSITFALGMALGGLLSLLGPVPALIIDSLTFVLAAALLGGLPSLAPQRNDRVDRGVRAAMTAVVEDLRQAAGEAWRSPSLLSAVLAKMPLGLAGGGAWVLLNLNAGEVTLVGAGVAIGLMQAARGIGTGLGPWWTAHRIERGVTAERAMGYAQWLTFASIAAFCLGGPLPLLLVWAFVWGLGVGTNWVVSTAELQRLAPDHFRGRLSAIDGLLVSGAMAISALFGAAVVDAFGVKALSGGAPLVLAVAVWFVLRSIRAMGARGGRGARVAHATD